MKTMVALCTMILLSAGCSTMTPARYSVSVDNNQALKQYEGRKVKVASIAAPASFDPGCRLMGPIQASDGMTIPQFIEKAFNDEFKFANIYGEDGVSLAGELTNVSFSSTSGLTNGWWDLGLSLKSSNGRSVSVSNRYDFKSGFDAITACNQTAQALGPAVQDLIKKTVTDPEFGALQRVRNQGLIWSPHQRGGNATMKRMVAARRATSRHLQVRVEALRTVWALRRRCLLVLGCRSELDDRGGRYRRVEASGFSAELRLRPSVPGHWLDRRPGLRRRMAASRHHRGQPAST